MSKSSAITGFFQILFRLVFFASVRELHHHTCDFCTVSVERIHLNRCTLVTVLSRVCFKMQGDAISSGFACISRRFSLGLVGSSARKTLQWRVCSENGPAGPGAKSREINAEMQAKTPKLRFRHFRNTLYASAFFLAVRFAGFPAFSGSFPVSSGRSSSSP